MKDNRVLYIGALLDEGIVNERGLRSHNAAGSNRVKRLSQALRSVGYRPIVMSASISMRAHVSGGPLLHPGRVRRSGGIAVVHVPALNIPVLGMLTSLFFQVAVMMRIMRQSLSGSIVYNCSPGLVLLTIWLALKPGVRVINNVEDIYIPRKSDWSSDSDARPVQQLVYWLSMQVISRLSDAYVVPTRRFLPYLPKKQAEVITGCIGIPPLDKVPPSVPPLKVLYAGKIEREHGVLEFVDALLLLDRTENASRLQADISGAGPESDRVVEKLQSLRTLRATHHGFVSSKTYADLLGNAHVCVALQDPEGRNSDFKTPSKIYEFLGFGKAVVATPVGDIRVLPEDAFVLLNGLSVEELVTVFTDLAQDPERAATLQAKARAHALEEFAYEKVGCRLKQLVCQRTA